MDLCAHVKSVIEVTTCKYHNENPSLGFINGEIVITTRCSDFKVICLKKLIRIFIEHRDQTLTEVWRRPRVPFFPGLNA